ncbi:Guanosine-diphosphatase [Tulasnella sp. 330]|nr:Guanosine-diphosphatase [Tulasnella sp. 330]KAG8873397.1 Guanosine-diphosphatase [Tulasnella sp. 331]KAG8877174.1 Guanosine-diphosphatase [Tulasnella sp. 332]
MLDAEAPESPKSSSSSKHSSSASISTALEQGKASAFMRPTKINILPRSANGYSPLDTSMGSSSSTGPRRFGWRSAMLLFGLFIAAVWISGPTEQYRKYTTAPGYEQEDVALPEGSPAKQPPTHYYPSAADDEDEDAAGAVAPPLTISNAPHSPETDPDPLKTVHCFTSFKPTSPIVQYALMLDAGSTGSRIHIYKFHNCLAAPTLEYEVFKMTIPGLSSFAGDPLNAAKSLDILMDEAVRVVPASLQGCTKVAVKATAGLRLLGTDVSEAILVAVQQRITSQYKFPLAGHDAVTIMDGKDEGVYAWITANYLLGTIGGAVKDSRPSYAVLDLGGASTQIVFEPTFATSGSRLEEGDHKYSLVFSGKTHTLYQHSYLGYGLMRARRSVHNLVAFMWDFRLDGSPNASSGPTSIGSEDKSAQAPSIPNPCLAKGTRRKVTLDGGKWKEGFNATMSGEDVGSFDHCNRIIELVMAKDAVCTTKPCSFNGVYQPNILETFPSGGILALSYFYDRIFPLLPFSEHSASSSSLASRAWGSGSGSKASEKTKPKSKKPTPGSIPISDIATLAQRVCDGPSSWETYWGPTSTYAQSFASPSSDVTPAEATKSIMAELNDRPEYCLDLTFMHALLRLGYEFGAEREVRVEKKVDGVELGWCLGAVIAMLLAEDGDGSLTCLA